MADFRCAAASLARHEPVAGSASSVRAFLLVENSGPWGVDALHDARLPEPVKEGLRTRASAARVRPLLVRRHRGALLEPGIRVFAAWADPHAPWLETTTLAGPEELLELDLEALGRGESPGLTPSEEPVVCVCTHGRHDACCAELGRPVAAALAESHADLTWEVSHIGGDRFAANVLVLPDGLYYGRVDPEQAPDLVRQHLDGHLVPELLRGRSGYAFAVQVAEAAVRQETGETGLRAVRLVSRSTSGTDTACRLEVRGAAYDVVVRRTPSQEHHLLTCRARRENPAPEHEVLSISRA